MKILLVHNEYQEPGGEDTVFRNETALLTHFGHHVVAYRRSNHEIERYAALDRLLLVKKAVWAEDSRRDLLSLIDRERPAIIHAHNTFTQISPSIYSACIERAVPLIQTLHNFRLLCPAATFHRDTGVCEECAEHSLWRGVAHGCYRNSRFETAAVAVMLKVHRQLHTWTEKVDCYIALSEFARRKFIKGGLPPDRISVKPNFVDPDPGESQHAGEYALFVGRLSKEKGLRTLLAAWNLLPGPIPLRIVGDGSMRSELEDYAAHHNLSSVVFSGRLAPPAVRDAIERARFLILPSECYENFPMTVVEAFASGVPVICSRLGAMQEIVQDNVTGLLFDPGNADDLAYKSSWAWSHPQQMRAMGREARFEFKSKYTAEKNYLMLMEVYRRAANVPVSVPLRSTPEELEVQR